jgi:hypothetical protein
VSKKVLLVWLKENASAELLKAHGLSGTYKQSMKKSNRDAVVAAYAAHIGA